MYSCWFCGDNYEPELSTADNPEEFCSTECEQQYNDDLEFENGEDDD